MKKITFLFLLGVITTLTMAQNAQNTMMDFNKTKVPGVIVALSNYDVAVVKTALTTRMERIGGLKGTNSMGFRFYPAQIFVDFGSTKLDIFTRVDAGTKKNKDIIVNLLVSTGAENFISQESDPAVNQKMLDFLSDFANNYLTDFDKKQKIDSKTSALKKMEKEYNSLVSARDKLQNELNNKEKAIQKKASEISKVKSDLDVLKR
jgi:hypothetical protein